VCRPVIGDAPFAVVLPDVIIDEYTAEQAREDLAAMRHRFDETGALQIMVEAVANE
jgi:UTP--glucose-1-phosphate uridylyltransferase